MRALAALLLAGCAHVVTVPASPGFVTSPSWHALTAEHRVSLTVRLDGNRLDKRTLHGLVAVERPGNFRLRALGPAGLALFDLLVRNGTPKVVSSIRDPNEGPLAEMIASLASDLACAYALDPQRDRSTKQVGATIVVEEAGRTVTLSRFAGAKPVWRHAEIETPRYHVTVEVTDVDVDPSLDPSMFAD